MIHKTLRTEMKTILKYLLIVFLIISLVFLAITLIIQANVNQVQRNEIEGNEKSLVDVEKTIISNKINRLVSDLLYVSDSLHLSYPVNSDYSGIEQQWIAFSNRKKIYDQIRYIGIDGDEIVRVNYDDAGAVAVDESGLQNKADRYYFIDTISLQKDQIYVSTLDLNIENDQIEEPIKPMIRLAVPFYGNSEELKGIVILNYAANDMLQQIREIASTSYGSMFMLNSDGYWLYNSEDSSKEWTFMYEDQMDVSFAKQYPNEWETIKSEGTGSLVSENGSFIYTNILTSNEFNLDTSDNSVFCASKNWYIVSYIPADSQNGAFFTCNLLKLIPMVLKKYFLVYIFIFFIALILAAYITKDKIESDKVKYYSEYDTMTGVYNRRSGFEKLSSLYKAGPKNNCKISVCFIDINGLKEVNDFLGHEAGDELILSVTNGVKESIRENDFVARLGGDEFLIIFEGLDEAKAEEVWGRVVEKYELINSNEKRKYVISVSHGIETFTCTSAENIDTVVNRADEKMYNEKRQIKRDLNVIR